MSFGQRLQGVRKLNNMTQEAFAEQLKVSRQAASKWESSNGYPEIEKILFICNKYNVSMDELFEDEIHTGSAHGKEATFTDLKVNSLLENISSFWDRLTPRERQIIKVFLYTIIVGATLLLYYKCGESIGKFIYNITH